MASEFHVLIIEDFSILRNAMVRGIGKLSGISVADAGSVDDAVVLIDERAPDIVFSDIDLPGRIGIEIIGELRKRGIRCKIIFVSGYLKAYGAEIPPNSNVTVLAKPVDIEVVRNICREEMPKSPALSFDPFTTVDYFQLACMGNKSVVIEQNSGSDVIGAIEVIDGDVWSARDQKGEGVDAFSRMIFNEDVPISCRTIEESAGARTINIHWDALLLEAARIKDEGKSFGDAQLAKPDDIAHDEDIDSFNFFDTNFENDENFSVSSKDGGDSEGADSLKDEGDSEGADSSKDGESLEDAEYNAIWDQGVQAMLSKDFKTSELHFQVLLKMRPDDEMAKANIKRLHEIMTMREK